MLHPSGYPESAANLSAAWQARCAERRVDTNLCRGERADELLRAVVDAIGQGNPTAALGRAARAWGGQFSEPSDAVTELTCLGGVLLSKGTNGLIALEIADASPTNGAMNGVPVDTAWPPRAASTDPLENLLVVWDQIMTEAVDAATSTLRSAALIDPLTGCANRRALNEDLARAVGAAHRSNMDLSVLVIDLDGLKAINDSEGHAAGDNALIELVATLRSAIRAADTLYRTGGDEFLVLCPFTDALGARELMRRAEHPGGPRFSWGTASLKSVRTEMADDWGALVAAADRDLYTRRHTRRSPATPRRRRVAVASVAASVVAAATAATVMATSPSNPQGSLAIGPNPSSQTTLGHGAGSGDKTSAGSSPKSGGTPSPTTTPLPPGSGTPAGALDNSSQGASTGTGTPGSSAPSGSVSVSSGGAQIAAPVSTTPSSATTPAETTLAADVGSGGSANSGTGAPSSRGTGTGPSGIIPSSLTTTGTPAPIAAVTPAPLAAVAPARPTPAITPAAKIVPPRSTSGRGTTGTGTPAGTGTPTPGGTGTPTP